MVLHSLPHKKYEATIHQFKLFAVVKSNTALHSVLVIDGLVFGTW